MAMPIDGFRFGGGWLHGFAAAGCAASGFAMAGFVTAGFEELSLEVASLAVLRLKQCQVHSLTLLKPSVSPRPQNIMLPNPM